MSQIATSTNIINKTLQSVITKDLPVGSLLNTGETISSISETKVLIGDTEAPVGQGHIAISSAVISGDNIRFTFSGGVADTVYRLYAKFTTSTSDTHEVAGRVFVGAV
jgi:hypothetical protein